MLSSILCNYIVGFFTETKNIAEIEMLVSKGVNVEMFEKKSSGALFGEKIVFTGSLSGLSRGEARQIAEAAGARVLSSVSADTDLVVAGEDAGSKLKKAVKLGVKVVNEDEFRSLLKQ